MLCYTTSMSLIDRTYFFLTPYTDAQEQAVGRFFKSLTEHGSQSQTRARLAYLLQRNIAVINLWTEYRYKGYKYLNKLQRKQLYANLQLIAEDFDDFCARSSRPAEIVLSHIGSLVPQATVDPKKAVTLQALMDYFSPARGVYEYRSSSSFGRLLRNPTHEKLIGDCNQIVTLYMYLYSRYYSVNDLQVRLLPEHVALHYGGIDIETTNGTFADYGKQQGSALMPAEEIVSINLLDTTDSYLSTHKVAAQDLLQASRFAFILSRSREIVTQNLNAAYARLVSSYMEHNHYNQALEFAKASGDKALLGAVGHNGAMYEIKRQNYVAARRFAKHAPKPDQLIRDSWYSEGIYYYQAHRYHDAVRAFKQINDQQLVRQCYEGLFFEEQAKLGSNPTKESIRKHAGTIKRMHAYAKRSGNKRLIDYANSLNKHL